MDILKDAIGAITNRLSGLWPPPAETHSLVEGRLIPCQWTPNGVSSESTDPVHHIDPLVFSGSAEQAWEVLKEVIVREGGTIQDEQAEYLWSTFLIPLFGYVDDVEFRLAPDEGVVHVRSSARFGWYDLNVNRTRVEQLRASLGKALQG
jgi:uncharacterized protein (DUF1499 family)